MAIDYLHISVICCPLQVRSEMLSERANALKEQEDRLGAIMAQLQMEKAREVSSFSQIISNSFSHVAIEYQSVMLQQFTDKETGSIFFFFSEARFNVITSIAHYFHIQVLVCQNTDVKTGTHQKIIDDTSKELAQRI